MWLRIHGFIRIKVPVVIIFLLWGCSLAPHLHFVEGPMLGTCISSNCCISALVTSPCTPKLWKRFVDDTFTVINKTHKEAFLEHLNSVNSNIQFTSEEPCKDGSIPFFGYVDYS